MVNSFFSSLWFSSVLVFPARLFVYAGSCAKAGRPPQTRHGCAVFLIAYRRAVKNPLAVLEFAASSSPYDDASIHPARGHPTAAAATQLMQRIMVDHARRGRVQRVATGRRVKQKAATR
jgi:hypothetical protein